LRGSGRGRLANQREYGGRGDSRPAAGGPGAETVNPTRPDKRRRPFPDLVGRDFTAPAPNVKWVGDMTEIPTDEGRLYLATVLDLFPRRLFGCPTSPRPDAELAGQAVKMAWRRVAARWPG
jgi:transposase InsO family protein